MAWRVFICRCVVVNGLLPFQKKTLRKICGTYSALKVSQLFSIQNKESLSPIGVNLSPLIQNSFFNSLKRHLGRNWVSSTEACNVVKLKQYANVTENALRTIPL